MYLKYPDAIEGIHKRPAVLCATFPGEDDRCVPSTCASVDGFDTPFDCGLGQEFTDDTGKQQSQTTTREECCVCADGYVPDDTAAIPGTCKPKTCQDFDGLRDTRSRKAACVCRSDRLPSRGYEFRIC